MDDAVCTACGRAYPIRSTHCGNDGTRLVPRRAQAPDANGAILDGRYQVRERIGEGVLGAVHLGVQLGVDRFVAIKLLRPAYATDDAGVQRFFEAATLACQLASSSIATSYDCGRTADGVVYTVMELARGKTLADEVRTRAVPVYRAIPIAIQLADALVAAHALGALHGDLKPTNAIVVVEPGKPDAVKVCDFGLTRALVVADIAALEPAQVQYLAPEVADGAWDARSDLYSLGCVLHELLAGRAPFTGTSTRAVLEQHARDRAPSLPRAVPPNLAAIVTTLLAKAPAERFESAMVVSRMLHAMQGTTPPPVVVPAPIEAPVVASGSSGSRGSRTGSSRPGRTGVSAAHSRPPVTAAHSRPPITQQAASLIGAAVPVPGLPSVPGPGVARPPPTGVAFPPAPSSNRRIWVIAIVAIVVSALGLLAFALASR